MRYLVPMKHLYLLSLPDLGVDEPALIEKLAAELQQVIAEERCITSGSWPSTGGSHRELRLLERQLAASHAC